MDIHSDMYPFQKGIHIQDFHFDKPNFFIFQFKWEVIRLMRQRFFIRCVSPLKLKILFLYK